jgi:aerobic-type carbon monoxide dehydrogenase small subunit (CoxS/CutS family)
LSSRSTDSFRRSTRGGAHLAETLREDLGLTGTKIACGEGHCGACTVQLDGVPVLSCITLVHTVGEREVTTIEGPAGPPLVDAFVRADALQCGFCTPGQIVSAAALVEAEPEPTPSGPARDGRQPLPLRRLPANRGGSSHLARLIQTEKEVEGRYTEQWVVVEGDDDALDQWPQGPGEVVGQPATAAGRPQRARGQAIFTADLQLPGMLHAAVLRVPSRARA